MVGGSDRTLGLWDVRSTGQAVATGVSYSPLGVQTRCLGLIPADTGAGGAPQGCIVGGSDGFIGVVYWTRQGADGTPLQKALRVSGNQQQPRSVNAVCVLPNRTALAGGGDGIISLWNIAPDPPAAEGFFSDGKPAAVSEQLGATSAAARSKTHECIVSMANLSANPQTQTNQVIAFAQSDDGTGGQNDYMAIESSVAHLDNAIRFWVV
jgi:WD40 repeat protein